MKTSNATMATVLALALVLPVTRSAAASNAERLIAQAQYKIQRNPNNAQAYLELGDAYVLKGRESGDMSQFELAEKALRKSLAINPQQSGALRHLAHVLSSRHDFADAAQEAQKAIALNANDADAHGVLGDAYLDMGQYDEAERSYKAMLGLKESLASYSRMSGLKSLKGDRAGAVADLKKAIELGIEQDQPGESIAWAQWQLGMEHFALGRLQDAEKEITAALKYQPNYHRALAGIAQVRAAQGKYEEAVDLYQKTLAAIPFPEYAAALGDVYQKLKRQTEAQKQYDLVQYIGKLSALNQALYNRELAYFYCDHDLKLAEALVLAQNEIKIRQDIQGYDLLAWSLYKNGQSEEAKTAMGEALKLGSQDAKLFFHAGMIDKSLGENAKARDFFQRALAINPYFHIFHAATAQRELAELGGLAGRERVQGHLSLR
jgi:tetratricopeptide (TPR) repeat protein